MVPPLSVRESNPVLTLAVLSTLLELGGELAMRPSKLPGPADRRLNTSSIHTPDPATALLAIPVLPMPTRRLVIGPGVFRVWRIRCEDFDAIDEHLGERTVRSALAQTLTYLDPVPLVLADREVLVSLAARSTEVVALALITENP